MLKFIPEIKNYVTTIITLVLYTFCSGRWD